MTHSFVYNSEINDKLDIYQNPDIKLTELKPTVDEEYRIELKGKSVDHSIVNALRRTIMSSIPIYGFHRSNIVIDVEHSKHMYNNDLLYNLIETLPIYDIPNNFDLENPEIYLPTEIMKKLFNHSEEKYAIDNKDIQLDADKRLFKIDMTINIKNDTTTDRAVSSHDIVINVDGKNSDGYLKRPPITILFLKPNELISLHAEANLGIHHGIYEATTNAIHNELGPNHYHLWYETLGQLDKKLIFLKACIILEKKLTYLKQFIKKTYQETDNSKVEIQIYGENHTLGNMLSTVLKKTKYVVNAGYAITHPFIDRIIIDYQLVRNSDISAIKLFIDCIDYLIKIFQKLIHQVR